MAALKKICSSMSQANKYVGNLIRSFVENEVIKNPIIQELLSYHPTKNINIHKLEWLKMKIRPPFNTLALFYKYRNHDKVDDISWKLCIRNLYGKYNRDEEYIKDVNTALRNEAHEGTKKQYYMDNISIYTNKFMGKCSHCNDLTSKIHTDHYPIPYKKILEDFLKEETILLENIDVYENNRNEIRLKDKCLAERWLKFHDNVADYRLLCASCNCSFGSYGY